ncbi:MAG: DUF4124 domain-containing protein [Pseudoxanthomonas sp.]
MRPLPASICLACLLAVAPLAAPAQSTMYQWKDASGVTHYSDTPPPKAGANSRYIAASASDAKGESAVASAPAESADCAKARLNQKILAQNTPVQMAGADGKPGANLSDAERASQREIAEQAIKAYCTPAK